MLSFLGNMNDQEDEKNNVIFSLSKALHKTPDIFVYIVYPFIYLLN